MSLLTNKYSEYILSILTINLFMYTLLLYSIFALFFMFDLKYIKTLSDLKNFNYVDLVSTTLVICFLSLAGIPPLLGFIIKFCIFIFYVNQIQYALIFIVILFNLFAMFFYIQNTRFIISKEQKFFFIFRENKIHISYLLIKIIILLNFVNFIGILIYNDIYIYFNNCFSTLI